MRALLAFASIGIASLAGCGATLSAQPEEKPKSPDERPRAEKPIGGGSGDASDLATPLTYRLPAKSAGESTAETWGLAAPKDDEGYSDPNRIVYDDAYVDAYVDWAVNSPIACGAATYRVSTPDGVKNVSSGLDESYLGGQFRAERLMAFLKQRLEGEAVERTFRVTNAELARVLRENPDSTSARRLKLSPWDRDTCSVISLLGLVRYKPALPQFKALLEDPNAGVRYTAFVAIGRLAAEMPDAVDHLVGLLGDEHRGGDAASALALADAAAVPALMTAIDSDEPTVRHRAVGVLGGIPIEAAEPALLAALDHRDEELRHVAVAVVLDMQTRGVAIDSDKLIDAVARRLADDANDDTRRTAAIVLLNAGPRAARVRDVLEKAAADRSSYAAGYAKRAIEAIDTEKASP